MTIAVRFENVTKKYGSHLALDDFSLSIPKGVIFALVGRNEAGKTTALKILLGLSRPTSGEVTLFDGDPAIKVGYLPDPPVQYAWMNAREYLHMSAGLAGLPQHAHSHIISKFLHLAHLEDDAHRISDYSPEECVRLGLAHAMIGDPDLLVLDEPTSALDPVGRHDVLDMIASLRGRTTIIICTHILEDAVHVADTIGVIEAGRMVTTGTQHELWDRANLPRQIEVEVTDHRAEIMLALTNDSWIESVELNHETLVVHTRIYSEAWERIPKIVLDHNAGLKRLELMDPSFDKVFFRLVGAKS